MSGQNILNITCIPNQKVDLEELGMAGYGVALTIKRLDLIHPVAGGNKYFKLKYNLEEARRRKLNTILTFGGIYSNHIAATALACHDSGLRSIGVIRQPHDHYESTTIDRAKSHGMRIIMKDHLNYRSRNDADFISQLKMELGPFFLIPEGGNNIYGIKGAGEIINEQDREFDHIVVCCGTGCTMAGIINSSHSNQHITGIAVLNARNSISESILSNTDEKFRNRWELNSGYTFGGYAKSKPELEEFIALFNEVTKIRVERVYTGKMMFGIADLIRNGHFKKGSRILAVHTGGLQYLNRMG